jgi:hypothetical protein
LINHIQSIDKKWRTTVTYGTGKAYKLQEVTNQEQEKIKQLIQTLFTKLDVTLKRVSVIYLSKTKLRSTKGSTKISRVEISRLKKINKKIEI